MLWTNMCEKTALFLVHTQRSFQYNAVRATALDYRVIMPAITSQLWCRLVNAYELKASVVCLQCKNCVIHTWALQLTFLPEAPSDLRVIFSVPLPLQAPLVPVTSYVMWPTYLLYLTHLQALVPVTEEVPVAVELHRFIIGSKGRDVRQLMEECDVSIQVPPADDNVSILRVTGTQENVARAKETLLQRVQQLEIEKEQRVGFPYLLTYLLT